MVDNVILLTVDALRADHVSTYGYDRETTPFLDGLADEHTRFEYAYAPSSHTRESIHAILTGKPPLQACTDSYRLAAETVASKLSTVGFETGGFHSNPYASRAYGYDGEFDTFDDDLYLGNSRLLALAQRAFDKLRNRNYARAETINERSLSWLDSIGDEPFFLWNHYMDVHGPYEPPMEYREQFTEESVSSRQPQKLYRKAAVTDPDGVTDDEQQLLVDLYDGEIRSTDDALRDFFDALDTRGLLEESLVIVTADHGDAFGEHGYYGHPRKLDEGLIRVPLIVRGGGFGQADVSSPASLLQLVPTILDAGGVDDSWEYPPLERNLSDDPPDLAFASARGQDEESNLRRFAAYDTEMVGHLTIDTDTERAVEEEHRESTVRDRLRAFSDVDEVVRDKAEGETTEDIERRLEALGYK